MVAQADFPVTPPARSGRWIDHWEPENPTFWARIGRRIAIRNLIFSIFIEHVGFSVWTMWSVFVLFMGPGWGIDPAGRFFLVSAPALVGAVLRVPYTFAVARFGGRNWTIVSGLLLLIPCLTAAVVLHPGTSYTTFVLVATLAGVGGGNFASSMTNINTFFPEAHKGLALGLNAGGGNIGVALTQLLGLLIISVSGIAHPRLLLVLYIPLVVLCSLCAAAFMDNVSSVRNDTGAAREALSDPHTAILAFLYIGTFGSFIGYSFAFGLVLQTQFGRTPLQAATVTFLGPLLGSLIRPVGGWLADRVGGARVTFYNYLVMAAAAAICIAASGTQSLTLFTVGFIGLFVFSGIGNGSTYKMIPAIFRAKAIAAIDAGADTATALRRARRISGAAIGFIAAVGALGGVLINLAFRQSFASAHSGAPAFYTFLGFYLLCAALTHLVYQRPPRTPTRNPRRPAQAYNNI